MERSLCDCGGRRSVNFGHKVMVFTEMELKTEQTFCFERK